MGSHIVVAGAGIIGLATAYEVARRGHRVTVLEKEDRVAAHQSGRNSGVIHSGLYYAPGSLKAQLGLAGASSMVRFAQSHGVAVDVCGKLVVATRPEEVPALEDLRSRGLANGVPLRLLTPEQARTFEPEVDCVAALRVESTGIIDFPGVAAALVRAIERLGGEVHLGVRVRGIRRLANGLRITTSNGLVPAHQFVACCGLQADRVARLGGLDPEVKIVPFRGEYFELAAHQVHLVKGLIYPVPDPSLPFLGVHLTRMIHGGVHAGPNAVLALAREGYRWRDVNPLELAETLRWPGLMKLGQQHWKSGVNEVSRSLWRTKFLASLRKLVPALADDALRPAAAGVRAQALRKDGTLVEDFHFVRGPYQLHVLNAPSPAATAALEIGQRIADELAIEPVA
ncbi:L-2-hydroxyglutarate oxidase [Granulicoccus sp. GXG6511]|uniref:L-2-hydroxyglutarate oxidase n=1 Tax=Granulicoccus sp. GXG6511 TaxID=3381351 RepID=UPI003D7DA575